MVTALMQQDFKAGKQPVRCTSTPTAPVPATPPVINARTYFPLALDCNNYSEEKSQQWKVPRSQRSATRPSGRGPRRRGDSELRGFL